MRNFTAAITFVMVFREIEKVYKEYCEAKGKEQSQHQDRPPSDDLMLTDSAVWQTVRVAQSYVSNVFSMKVIFLVCV